MLYQCFGELGNCKGRPERIFRVNLSFIGLFLAHILLESFINFQSIPIMNHYHGS